MRAESGRSVLLFLCVGVALLAGYRVMRGAPPLVDEVAYYRQILSLKGGNFTLDMQLSALPGYAGLMALAAKILGISSLSSLRFLTLFVSLGAIAAFFLLARTIQGRDEPRRTAVLASLPIVVPFLFLLYTDVLSMLLVFASLTLLLRGRHAASGILATLSLVVRQNNVMWILFMLAVAYVGASGWRPRLRGVRDVLGTCWTHVWGLGLFVLFVVVNKGVAVQDRGAQPMTHFSAGNLYFLLLVFFVVFLPLHIARAGRVVALIQRRPWVLALVAVLFLLYMLSFDVHALHPYNLKHPGYFLRNIALIAITSTPLAKALAFLPIAWSILALCATRLSRPTFLLLYPFTVLYLIPSWLIEQRYYLVPLGLFLAFREEDDPWWERATIALNLVLAAAVLYVTRTQRFFL